MAQRPYSMPPLKMMATFECAARRESFKHAAAELNVTPGAISHQVKSLETALGFGLFERHHRKSVLTKQGRILYQALEKSFSDISDTLALLRQDHGDGAVSFAATTAVSSLWLTPRITRYWKLNGDVPIHQFISDRPGDVGHNSDLMIRYGRTAHPEKWQSLLFQDELVPVCSPNVLKEVQGISLEELAQSPLIHLHADDSRWTTWQHWFQELGFDGPVSVGSRFNNYAIALQAACEDAGIVLGWRRLVQPLLDRKELAVLAPFSLPAPSGFYIISEAEGMLSDNARKLRRWLLEHVNLR